MLCNNSHNFSLTIWTAVPVPGASRLPLLPNSTSVDIFLSKIWQEQHQRRNHSQPGGASIATAENQIIMQKSRRLNIQEIAASKALMRPKFKACFGVFQSL